MNITIPSRAAAIASVRKHAHRNGYDFDNMSVWAQGHKIANAMRHGATVDGQGYHAAVADPVPYGPHYTEVWMAIAIEIVRQNPEIRAVVKQQVSDFYSRKNAA